MSQPENKKFWAVTLVRTYFSYIVIEQLIDTRHKFIVSTDSCSQFHLVRKDLVVVVVVVVILNY